MDGGRDLGAVVVIDQVDEGLADELVLGTVGHHQELAVQFKHLAPSPGR